ncbi:MAG TPA: hypothetical protein VEC06_10305 [Paucimonas sp.]|nr:hypothetical protein [Paucimonas sp.]
MILTHMKHAAVAFFLGIMCFAAGREIIVHDYHLHRQPFDLHLSPEEQSGTGERVPCREGTGGTLRAPLPGAEIDGG